MLSSNIRKLWLWAHLWRFRGVLSWLKSYDFIFAFVIACDGAENGAKIWLLSFGLFSFIDTCKSLFQKRKLFRFTKNCLLQVNLSWFWTWAALGSRYYFRSCGLLEWFLSTSRQCQSTYFIFWKTLKWSNYRSKGTLFYSFKFKSNLVAFVASP